MNIVDRKTYRELFDQFPEGCLITDISGLIVDVSYKISQLVGKSVEDLINLPLTRIISEDHRDRFHLHLACITTGNHSQPPSPEIALVIQPDSQPAFQATLTAIPIAGDDHELEYFGWRIRTAVPDGQNRLAENQTGNASQLAEIADKSANRSKTSEGRFRTVFDDAALGIALLDKHGVVLDANEALHKILGYSGEEIAGKNLLDYGYPEDVGDEKKLFGRLIQNEIEYFEYEGRFLRKDGELRWGKHLISRVKEVKQEEPTVAIALVEDFTEKELSQDAMIRTERLAIAGRLGASLAHEINNPLQAVLGSLGLVDEMIEEEEAHRFLSVAMDELERAARIVEQLRDLGKPIIQKDKQVVNINSLVEKTLLLTRRKRENFNIELVWNKIESPPLLKVSPDQIQQVLLNLVINAIQAMENGGILELSTSYTQYPEGILIKIQDDGKGMPSEVQMKLFEPFYSTRSNGLGLGLFVSQQIIQQHMGNIRVESEKGLGSTVSIWLPIDQKDQQ